MEDKIKERKAQLEAELEILKQQNQQYQELHQQNIQQIIGVQYSLQMLEDLLQSE